jgi:hypothetical protein
VPGTVSVIGPRLVEASTEDGATANVAMMPPALDRKFAVNERRSTAVISPASARAVTGPDSEVSVIEPAPVYTRSVTSRGTATV